MTQTPQDPDLFSDLQQFLYDARDQFLALENIRTGLDEIAKTTVSQRKGVGPIGRFVRRITLRENFHRT